MTKTTTWPMSEDSFRPWLDVANDWRRSDATESYSLYWSDVAQFGQILPRPSASAIAKYYEVNDYYTHGPDAGASDAVHRGVLQRALMSVAWRLDRGIAPTSAWWKAVPPEGARSCVDIGCGDGSNLAMLAPYLDVLVGVEPDPKAREAASARGIRVMDGVAESLPGELVPGSFDLVVISHVLEHCRDPIAALANARDLMSDRGVLMVETPNSAALGCKARGAGWYWLDVPRHLNFFTEDSLRTLCAHVALLPQRAEYSGFVRQFSRAWIEAETRIEARLDGRAKITAADFRRNFYRQVALLLRSGLAPARRKYDSVRLICTKA